MDIVRKKQNKLKWPKKVVPFALLAAGLAWALTYAANASNSVSASTVQLAKVNQGQFKVDVRGVGILVPREVYWVATEVSGRVEQVQIKAGAAVKKGDVIVKLANPELVQQLEGSVWELEQVQAELNAQTVVLEAQVLDQESLVARSELDHDGALLTLNAQKKLFDQGIYTISSLEHERVKIQVNQFKQRWQLEQKRLVKSQESFAAQKRAFAARIKRLERQVDRMRRLVDKLTVRASIDSVVQEMPLELGQQVALGANVAKLARNDEFIAEIRIPEKQIYQVALGQTVTVDTKTSKVAGKVIRIDPAVNNGSVQVDIQLTGGLPPEARPELTVDGIIHVAQMQQVLYVQRPMYAKANSTASVYRFNPESKEVELLSVTFGRSSQTHIQITNGLRPGDDIVVSDISTWKEKQISAIQ